MKANNFYSFGIDIGGTYTKVGLFEVIICDMKPDIDDISQVFNFEFRNFFYTLKIIDFTKFPTQNKNNSEYDFQNLLLNNFEKMLANNNIKRNNFFGFSFATPGFVDNKIKKVVGNSFNISFLDKINFREIIDDFKFNTLFLSLINDVTSQAFYEQIKNKKIIKSDDDIALLVALGTGIGGAIFTKKDVIMGKNGWAAEFGHIPIWFNSLKDKKNQCTCGKINCSESFASVNAYIRMLREKNINISAEEALQIYYKSENNSIINEITEFWLDALGSLCASLVNIFNPSSIIISGAIVKIEKLIESIYKKAKEYSLKLLYENVLFSGSSSADNAGCYGALIHGIKAENDSIRSFYGK